MNYVLSYPRSGVTWFRYCVEQLTGRPTLGPSEADLPICNRDDVQLDVDPEKEYVLFKRHSWNKNEITEDDFLFLIVRNHVETLSRHYTSDGHNMRQILNQDVQDYVENIEKFQQFQGEKLQLYYEDLIEDEPLREILNSLKYVLPVIDGRIKSFMDNIDFHRQQSLESYPQSKTKGKKKVYHQKKLDHDQRTKIDSKVRLLSSPEVYNQYLSHYFDG